MAQTVADVMTTDPVTVPVHATVRQAAELMRDHDIGNVVLLEGDGSCAIVTDRDLVVRVLAAGGAAEDPVGQVASSATATVTPSTSVQEAARLMVDHAVRRLPVLDGGRIVGVVSLGDLAVEQDPNSVLGGISAAQPSD